MAGQAADLTIYILQIESIIDNLNKHKESLNTLGKDVKDANTNLIGNAWKGASRDVYADFAKQWENGYDELDTDLDTLISGLGTILECAHALNSKALNMPSYVDGWGQTFGSHNKVSWGEDMLRVAKDDCVYAVGAFETVIAQLGNLTSLSGGLSCGQGMLGIDAVISSIGDKADKRTEQLSDLRDAFAQYGSAAEELGNTATQAFSSISFPAGWDSKRVGQAEKYDGMWNDKELQSLPPEAVAQVLEKSAKMFFTLFPNLSYELGEKKFPLGPNLWIYYNQTVGLSLGEGNVSMNVTRLNGIDMLTSLSSQIEGENASLSYNLGGGVSFTAKFLNTEGIIGSITAGYRLSEKEAFAEGTAVASLGEGSYVQTLGICAKADDLRPVRPLVENVKPIQNTWTQNAWIWTYENAENIVTGVAGGIVLGLTAAAAVLVLGPVGLVGVAAAAATIAPVAAPALQQATAGAY